MTGEMIFEFFDKKELGPAYWGLGQNSFFIENPNYFSFLNHRLNSSLTNPDQISLKKGSVIGK